MEVAPHLSLAFLCSGYSRAPIVNDVCLSVFPGEIVAVIGRNGVGKTTLMKTIAGVLPMISGTLMLRGIDVTNLDATRRARLGIGYVPQGREVFGRMSVAENLALGVGIGAAPKPDFERAFGFFPVLKKRLSQAAGSMSGGEQQQLAIGRILVGQPNVILLDEPSEGIQPNIVQEIGQIVRRLCVEERITVLIVEQNLALIRSVADRCLIMDKGTIVSEIKPQELDSPEAAVRYLSI